MTSFLRTRILFSLALGLFVLTASAMADVTYDSAAGTFTGDGTYSGAVNSTKNLTATPTTDQTITFTSNIVSTGNFTQNGAYVVFDTATVNSFNSLFINNNGSGNGAKMTLSGSTMTLTELHVANSRTTHLDITDGASLSVSGVAYINEANGAHGIITQTGGTVSFTTSNDGDVRIGHWPNTNYPSRYDISGGSLSIPNTMTYVGWDGYAEMNISGSATVSLKGLSLSNSGTGQGTLRLTGGTLNIGDGGIVRNNRGASGPKAVVINLGNGTINATASHSWGSDMTVTLNSGTTTTFNVDSDKTITMNSTLAGSGTLTKTGGGTLAITNNSSSLGKIVVNGGTVVAQNNANAINATNGVDLNAGTLQISNLQNVQGSINANGGTIQSADGNNSFVGDVTLSAATTIDVADSYTFNTTGTIGSASGDNNVYQISKTGAGTWNIAGTVNCGYFNPAGGTVKVISGGELNATQLVLRQANGSDTYTFTVAGGSVNITGNDHRLGHWPNHTGVVNINSGSFSAADTVSVGWDGTGKLYQTGGTATFNTLDLRNTSSLIEFSGGTTNIATLNIGVRRGGSQAAAGSVTFKGTSNVTLNNLYAYHGGTLKIQDNAKVTVSNEAYFVQANNSCTFTIEQTGGTFTVNGKLALGHYNYSDVTYNISGGTLNVPNFSSSSGQSGFWLAVDSNGTLNQSGGTINTGRLNLNARDGRQTGTYVMTGGTLNVGTGGIMASESGSGRYVIKLQKGTITAGASSLTANKGNWSSNLNMELTGTGDDRVTFKPESGYSIALSGALSGSGGMIKDGAGTLTISGANTYTGDTAINAGTLELTGNGTMGTGAVANSGTLKFNYSADKTLENAISGTGAIVKQGTNKVNLDGTFTSFTGDVAINGGTLSVLMNGTNKSLNVNNLSGSGDLELRISNGTGNIQMANLQNNNFTGVISLVSNNTDGSKFYIKDSNYQGFTFRTGVGTTIYVEKDKELKGNVLLAGDGNSENRGALRLKGNMSGNITVIENASIAFDNAPTVSGNISSGAASGESVTLFINGKTDGTATSSNDPGTFTGVISDGTTGSTLGINIRNNTQTFSGANTYSGGTTITAGALKLTGAGTMGTGAVSIASGATLTFASDLTQTTIANPISGTGKIVKEGTNTVNLNGRLNGNTNPSYSAFTGNVDIKGGTLSVRMNGSSNNFSATNLSGSGNLELRLASGTGDSRLPNLTYNSDTPFTGVISLVSEGGANGNKINTGNRSFAGFTFVVNSGTSLYAESGTFAGNVKIYGDGNTDNRGALRLATNMSGNITVMDNAGIAFNGSPTVSGNISSGAATGESVTLFINGKTDGTTKTSSDNPGTFTGAISDGTSGSTLGINIRYNTQTFSGALSYTGATTIHSQGTMVLSGANANLDDSSAVTVNGTLNFAGYTGASDNTTLDVMQRNIMQLNNLSGTDGVIVGTGKDLILNNDDMSKFIGSITAKTITKTGDETLKIYAAASAGGIQAESLVVSSGNLDFKGYMTGGITVDANAVFSPGNSVGEATFGGGYILNDGATLLIEQDATGMDKLTASSFEIHPNSILDLTLGSVQSGEYVILEQKNGDSPVDFGVVTIGGQTYDYSDASFWNSLLSEDDAYYWNLSVNGNKVMASIDANAVPEPSTWALLILGAAGLLYWRKRKNA